MSNPLTIPDLLETPVRDASKRLPGVHIVPSPEAPTTAARWWRIADFGVLGAWMAVVAFTLQYHEKWADEAQAWLIARDLNLKTIWFHELRYEGSPGLWHTILWVAQHLFHARYNALGYIGMAGATAGVALLVFKAPFPRYIRWPLAFTYFMVYQYAVIARPYTLLPLLAFSAALLFKDLEHPERMTIVLVLLANLSLHGTILAGCLGLVYLLDAYRSWGTLDVRVRKRYWICIGVMTLTFAFIVLILKPTPDVGEFAKRKMEQMPASIQAMQPTTLTKLESVISGAFLDYWLPSALFILFTGWWCFRRRRLLLFAVPLLLLTGLYALVHGYAHHHGTLFVAMVTAVWVAWPTREERHNFGVVDRREHVVMTAVLLGFCALNIWDGVVAGHNEYLYPYSGAEDAARYLKSVGAEHDGILGFLYGQVGIQAYFDRNMLVNMPTAYYHHGMPFYGLELNREEFARLNPGYVIVFTEQPQIAMDYGIPEVRAEGYEIVHFSDGYMIYKRGVYVRQCYFILRRVRL
jgi:hypothetical protein